MPYRATLPVRSKRGAVHTISESEFNKLENRVLEEKNADKVKEFFKFREQRDACMQTELIQERLKRRKSLFGQQTKVTSAL